MEYDLFLRCFGGEMVDMWDLKFCVKECGGLSFF